MGYQPVAPRVGAWIETGTSTVSPGYPWSHPVWVRGLKPRPIKQGTQQKGVAPRVGAWIETPGSLFYVIREVCRTPCGCVD